MSTQAKILHFQYPTKPGRWSDRNRILTMYKRGEITIEERNAWLKAGGHEEEK